MPEKHEVLPKPNWEQHYAGEFQNFRQEIEKLKAEKVQRGRQGRGCCSGS